MHNFTDIMQQLKTFKNNQAVAFGVKKTGSDQAPVWFQEFALKQEKFNEEVKTFMVEQKKFNKEQKEFNETIVRLNNLKTE